MSEDKAYGAIEGLGDVVERVLRRVQEAGAEFADARIQYYEYGLIVYDNGRLKEDSYTTRSGVGIRVIYNGAVGYSSTNSFTEEAVRRAAEDALRSARALAGKGGGVRLADYPALKATARSNYIVDPFTVGEEKYEVARQANEAGLSVPGVVSAVTRLGMQRDKRLVVNSEGLRVEVETVMVGLSHASVAKGDSGMEYSSDYDSAVAGFEYIRSMDVEDLALSVSRTAVAVANAPVPKAGVYDVVLDPHMVGLLLHEAFGHASEGDLVVAGASAIAGKLGEKVAAEIVTIYDDGLVQGGYYVPYDDEGVEKKKVEVVREGILSGYLTDRASAAALGLEPTGNGRVMSYGNPVIVRQTNYYMAPGDHRVEELLEGIEEGLYITAKGAKGGQVDPGMGTFTFGAGASWMVRRGRLVEPVRGVSLSGQILDVLKRIDAVGRDLGIETSVFGGCGKDGQLVRVGTGGPHVRVRGLTVGGR